MTHKTIEGFLQEVADNRAKKAKESDQLSLGELISKIEPYLDEQEEIIKKYGGETSIVFDFEYIVPCGIHSWRGSYSEIAIDFNIDGDGMTISAFLDMLKDAVGKSFCGYKGGEYTMSEDTPVWVARREHSGKTGITGVEFGEYEMVLTTSQFEF